MCKIPFELLIRDGRSDNTVICEHLVRQIPGRRQVYEGKWGHRDVFIKVFADKFRSRGHALKEWRGLKELNGRGLNCPEGLFFGKTESRGWAIVTAKVDNASTAWEIFQTTTDETDKLALLIDVCKEIVRQHKKGVVQSDLHLGNFLVRGSDIFALDAGQMCFYNSPINKSKSIRQLAQLACNINDENKAALSKLFDSYYEFRGWQKNNSDTALLNQLLIRCRQSAVNRSLKKTLRTSKRYLHVKDERYNAVFVKSFIIDDKAKDFINNIDSLMDSGIIFKNGNTCYVSRAKWNGADIVIKRYNHKGLLHSIRHTLKKSRARRCWLNGHRLLMLNIPTPKPLAFIEKRNGPIVWQSYIVTEYAAGRNLSEVLRDKENDQLGLNYVNQIEKLLEKLSRYGICHGDMKHSNILITDTEPVLTDLDSMKVYGKGQIRICRQNKDLADFRKRFT